MTTITSADGERADFPGLGNRFLVRSDRTDGRFAMLEHTLAPRALGAPMHTHRNEDEYSFVLTGRMSAMVGDEVVYAGPGELVVKPRGVPHAFWNAIDEETRVLELAVGLLLEGARGQSAPRRRPSLGRGRRRG